MATLPEPIQPLSYGFTFMTCERLSTSIYLDTGQYVESMQIVRNRSAVHRILTDSLVIENYATDCLRNRWHPLSGGMLGR